jgi:amino acid adenylation domain-containing protein
MTTAAAILEELQELGVELEISGDKLRYVAPRGVITDALRARLVEHKSEIVFLLSVGNGALLSAPPIARRKNDGANTAPLSFGQERLWFLNQLEPASPFYNICLAVRLLGGLNLEALHRSFNEVVRRHEILRTSFAVVGEQPLQVIAPSLTLPLTVIDLGEIPHSGPEAHALRLASEESRQPFDLTRGPLLRVTLLKLGDQEHILLLTVHHIIFDGWSIGNLFGELAAAYEAWCAGKPPRLPELAVQFADFARWQRDWLQGEVLKSHLAYWKQRLDGAASVLELPADHSRPATQTYNGAKHTIALSSHLTEALKALCKQEGVTLFIALLAAFKTLIYRYTGQEDLLTGTLVANRVKSELEPLVGFFVNTLVIRTALWGNQTFRELLRQVHQSALGAYAHQSLPFERIVDELHPERDASRAPLLQTMFVLQNAPLPITKMADLSLVPLEIDNGTAKFDLLLSLRETEPGLVGALEYSTDLFEAATIARMAKHFETLLEAVVDNPNQPLSGLPLMTSQERQRLREWNETRAAYPGPECIHELFEQQVKRTPDAISVIFNGEQITYEELDRKANQLAHHLRALGVGAETLVGICTERSIKMVIGLLGILKAGGAYVPLDPAYPKERLAFVLEDASLPVLVTQTSLRDKLPEHRARAVYLDTEWDIIAQERMDNLASGVRESNLAYVIYTSGSTGRPKGVAIEHRSPVVLLHWAKDAFVEEDWAGVLASTSICFDLSVFELFVPLSWGGKVILAENALHLPHLPAAEEVTLINTVPSAMTELLKADGVPASVRTVNLAGEALPGALVRRIYERDSIRQVFNLYGPSEDTTYSTYTLVERSDTGSPTIGRPIANTQVSLLDANFQLVPVGLRGELHIGGAGLARGYLNRPDLTAEKFLPDPFSTEPGARLYRTGDVARYVEGGIIDFLGRMDNQVKIRGFRIELGEIEAVLRQHDAVKQALVVVREDIQGDKRLVAYVVPMTQSALRSHELRDYLKEKLPDYMVPQAFVIMSAFPLTQNGKVDRRALPAPARRCASEGEFIAPRDPFEEEVAAIWASVLGLQEVGIHSNFFELGGHSLLGMQVISRLRNAFQIDLPVRRLFESPRVADLAECIRQERVEKMYMQAPPIEKINREGKLPLSFSQWRLWFLDQLMPDNSAYNIFQALRLTGPLDVEALRQSFNEIVRRHEVLRTYFAKEGEEPVQVIVPSLTLDLPLTDISSLPPSAQESSIRQMAIEEARRKFILAEVPLLRTTLLKLNDQAHVLFLNIHHIISDDWSVRVFIREISSLYKAFSGHLPSPLDELPIQYADFAQWQHQWLKGEVLESQLSYWMKQLSPPLPVLDLPTDRLRPAVQTHRGAHHQVELSASLTSDLKTMGFQEGTTLFMNLLAAYAAVLHRCSGQEDIIIGIPIANRTRVEIEGLIGFFVNLLVPRISVAGNPSYRELLQRVREVVLDAYDHQELPFEKLVEGLQLERDMSRPPVRQVAFSFTNARVQPVELPHLKISPLPTETGMSKLDITLFMWEQERKLKGVIEYNADLFEAATIARFSDYLKMTLEEMIAHPHQPILKFPPLVKSLQRPPAKKEKIRPIAEPIEDKSRTAYAASNLTEGQLLFWFSQKLRPEVQLYFDRVVTTFTINGEVDRPHFQRAFQKLIDHSDALRSVIVEVDGIPQRKVRERLPFVVNYLDFSDFSDPPSVLEEWIEEQLVNRSNLEKRLFDCALLKIAESQFIWYLNVHHIITDLWSEALIVRLVSDYYRRSIEGELDSTQSLPPFQDYVDYERGYRASDHYREAEEYWKQKLSNAANLIRFYRTDAASQTLLSQRVSSDLGEERSLRIAQAANRLGLFSPAVVFLATLFAYLHRLTDDRTLRVGSSFANRAEPFKQTLGLLFNICPLQVDISGGETFNSLARKLQLELVQTAKYQNYPVRNPVDNKVYDINFTYQNVSFPDFGGLPAQVKLIYSGYSNYSFALQVRDFEAAGRFVLDFDFNGDAFNDQQRRQSIAHFLHLLDAFLADSHQPLHNASMFSSEELASLVTEFNRTQADYPQDQGFSELFEAQGERTPEAIAASYEGERITYAEMNRRANRLARALVGEGVGADQVVALLAERSIDFLIAVIAVFKAGGAYLPLDPRYPAARALQVLEQSKVSVVVAANALLPAIESALEKTSSENRPRLFPIEELLERDLAEANFPPRCTPHNLAYVIYTSGSTGVPKGAMIEHKGMLNHLYAKLADLNLAAADVVAQTASQSFDISVWQFLAVLLVGGRIHIFRDEVAHDPVGLLEQVESEGISIVEVVPSLMHAMLDQMGAAEPFHPRPSRLRWLLATGEALPPELCRRWFAHYPGIPLLNAYGPTECSDDVTHYPIYEAPPENTAYMPIGHPVSNLRAYVLSRDLQPVPIGIAGELHIGGVGVGRGYLNDPKRTVEVFIPDSFGQEPGARLYKTGDLARYQANGCIEFLGRGDHQVKIRGYRIELDEIASVLNQCPAVREAVVMAREDRPGNKQLVAYITANRQATLSVSGLRSFLREQLPDYMVPSAFVILGALPLTPNGKIDRKALPAPDPAQVVGQEDFVAPRSSLEQLLAEIWTDLLGIEQVSAHDNFFELGGHSLLATQLLSRLQKTLPVKLALRTVFESPTIAKLAAALSREQREMANEDQELAAQILSKMSQLSEGEVEALLFSE